MLLSKRLFGDSTELMDYVNVPTTVFTPLEYGCCGYSEEDATTKFGEDNISVYHTGFKPLEWEWNKYRPEGSICYVKYIITKADGKVIGFHILAPNAGEVTQGIAIAMKCGVTRDQIDATVGIHPTVAEEVTTLDKTKADDPNAEKTGC